jgi:uncharacterized membrane protein YciS (DUF1049 family)
MSIIAYLFWGLLVGIILLGVLFDKLFPNKVKFNETEHVKSANQQLNENASLNNKSTSEITGSFIP